MSARHEAKKKDKEPTIGYPDGATEPTLDYPDDRAVPVVAGDAYSDELPPEPEPAPLPTRVHAIVDHLGNVVAAHHDEDEMRRMLAEREQWYTRERLASYDR